MPLGIVMGGHPCLSAAVLNLQIVQPNARWAKTSSLWL